MGHPVYEVHLDVLVDLPVANGSLMQWNGTGFSALVDPGGPDEDLTQLNSALTGNIGLVRCHRPVRWDQVAAVSWVSILCRARRLILGGPGGTIAPRVYSGGMLFEGSSVGLSSSYQDFDGRMIQPWQCERDPATGDFWTLDAALAAEVGLRDASSDDHVIRWTLARKLIAVKLLNSGNAVRYPVN